MRLIYVSLKDEGRTNGSVLRWKRMGMGKQVDIAETKSYTDKSHRDTNAKGNRHRRTDQIRK